MLHISCRRDILPTQVPMVIITNHRGQSMAVQVLFICALAAQA